MAFGAGIGITEVQAELVEIPLPELAGTYPLAGYAELATTFPFLMDPANIISVSLRVTGTLTAGTLTCDGFTEPWPMDIGGFMPDDTSGGWWWASPGGLMTSGPFTFTAEFQGSFSGPATWNFLGDETGDLIFSAIPAPIVGLCAELESVEPTAVVDEVVLILDMVSTVPIRPLVWGTTKAWYR